MRENFLAVYGHAVMDYIIKVPRLPAPNTSIELVDRRMYFGGTGGNIARMASTLGVKTALASFVGNDFPEEYENALREAGVDITDLTKVPGYKTPVAWIFSDANHNQMAIIDQGPVRDSAAFDVQKHSVTSSEIVHICTGRPQYYERVLELARDLGKKVSFDPAQEIHYVYKPETFRRLLRMSNHFFANENELEVALKFLNMKDPEELASKLDLLVVTKGTQGSEVYTESGKVLIPAIESAKVEEATGVGDAYRAGFYAAWSRGMSLEDCGWFGAAAASFAIETLGAQMNMPTWKKLYERVKRYKL